MSNPWTLKKRPFWTTDPEFQEFNKKLYNESWTFEKTCEVVQFDNYIFCQNREEILKMMKLNWMIHAKEW